MIHLHFTIVASDGISIRHTRFEEKEAPVAAAKVIDLAKAREDLKCKRCNGIGLIEVEQPPLHTFADSIAIGADICPYCRGKGRRERS